MPVKCGNCGYFLEDTVTEQKCIELQFSAGLIKIIGNVWGNISGRDRGEDILNRLDFKCPNPKCGYVGKWKGASENDFSGKLIDNHEQNTRNNTNQTNIETQINISGGQQQNVIGKID